MIESISSMNRTSLEPALKTNRTSLGAQQRGLRHPRGPMPNLDDKGAPDRLNRVTATGECLDSPHRLPFAHT
jgi:hypothetical protein